MKDRGFSGDKTADIFKPIMPNVKKLYAVTILVTASCGLLTGCKSAEEKCNEAQKTASTAWDEYVKKLEPEYRKSMDTQRKSQVALAFEIQKRISKIAEKKADELYARGDEAWQREYHGAYVSACQRDKECSQVRYSNSRAQITARELKDKMEAAEKARDSSVGSAEEALHASALVLDDSDNKELIKAARTASEEAHRLCRDVRP